GRPDDRFGDQGDLPPFLQDGVRAHDPAANLGSLGVDAYRDRRSGPDGPDVVLEGGERGVGEIDAKQVDAALVQRLDHRRVQRGGAEGAQDLDLHGGSESTGRLYAPE